MVSIHNWSERKTKLFKDEYTTIWIHSVTFLISHPWDPSNHPTECILREKRDVLLECRCARAICAVGRESLWESHSHSLVGAVGNRAEVS